LEKTVATFKRVVAVKCKASGLTQKPEITEIEIAPPLVSDPSVVRVLAQNFKEHFGSWTEEMKLDTTSDDFPNQRQTVYLMHTGTLAARTTKLGRTRKRMGS
jgi:metal-dependent amidase/aminoacylase/carboxypeptidase family protein